MSRGKLLNTNLTALFDIIRPIGSLYSTVDSAFNPNNASGWHGTWERITDCMIYASGENDTIGQIVGSNTHTLTVDEMAEHDHTVTVTGGNHNHYMFAESGGTDSGIPAHKNNAVSWHLESTSRPIDYSMCASSGDQSLANSGVTRNSGNLSMSGTTSKKGSNTPIDIRPRRLNCSIWRRIA